MSSPETSFSSTILEFATPVLGPPAQRLPYDVTKSALTFVITVWNAHAMALPAWGHPEHLQALKDMLAQPEAAGAQELFAVLSESRQQAFRLDARVVGEWELVDDEGGEAQEDNAGQRRLRCEMRLPGPRPAAENDENAPELS